MAAASVSTSSESSTHSTTLVAWSDYLAADSNQLSFKRGDRFRLIEDASEHWWWCELRGKGDKGYVPVNHVVTLDRRLKGGKMMNTLIATKLHLEMLEDQPRTTAYMKAVQLGAGFLQDKVVLDVGCGTGILSMFCARTGNARKVYAIEASKLAVHTQEVVKCNGLEDRVEVIHGKIEDVDLPDKVDLIISEWMGTLLLFELMLESVLSARDRFLKQDGVMWPSEAHLFLVPCTAQLEYDRKLGFWECQYGFDFSPLIPLAECQFFGRPLFNHKLCRNDCLSESQCIVSLNTSTLKESEIECFTASYTFFVERQGNFHGFASWFEVVFGRFDCPRGEEHVRLCTGPDHEQTHWKQDLFMLDEVITVEEKDEIQGNVVIKGNPYWRRHLKVTFKWKVLRRDFKSQSEVSSGQKEFLLWR